MNSSLSPHKLALNAVWNFAGLAAPMLVGVFSIPLLLEYLGNERFGILTLVWMGVGYFSVFDMGLGRALTNRVASQLGQEQFADIPDSVWTTLALVVCFGIFASFALWFSSGFLVQSVFKVPEELQAEAIGAFRMLALSIPAVLVTSTIVGLLESYQNFFIISAIRLPLGIITFAGPLMSALVSPNLLYATTVLVLARVIAMMFFWVSALKIVPGLRVFRHPSRALMKSLLASGGWMSVSNLLGPLLTTFDRFLIASLLTMTAVAHYVTPYEVLSRMQVLPYAIISVLFPALTRTLAEKSGRVPQLYQEGCRALFFSSLPLYVFAFLFASESLGFWVGPDFSAASTRCAQWLAAGWIMNTLARMPFTMIQSMGRPDVTAKIHMTQVLPYGIILWFLTLSFGISGVAAAWFLRSMADMVMMNLAARKLLPELKLNTNELFLWTALALGGLAVTATAGTELRMLIWILLACYSCIRLAPFVRGILTGHPRNFSAS